MQIRNFLYDFDEIWQSGRTLYPDFSGEMWLKSVGPILRNFELKSPLPWQNSTRQRKTEGEGGAEPPEMESDQ